MSLSNNIYKIFFVLISIYMLVACFSCSNKKTEKIESDYNFKIDSLNHFTNIRYGHFSKFRNINGKISAHRPRSSNIFIYKNNGKLDFIISYKDYFSDYGYCKKNNKYYLLSSYLIEYNRKDNTFKQLLKNNNYYGRIEIDGNLIILKSLNKTAIYNIISNKVLFEAKDITSGGKRIDIKKSLLLAKKNENISGILNYSIVNNDTLLEKWIKLENYGSISKLSKSGEYVFGYVLKDLNSYSGANLTIFNSSNGKVFKEVETSLPIREEIGNYIILRNSKKFQILNSKSFQIVFDSKDLPSNSKIDNFIITNNDEFFIIKNKSIHKCDYNFNPIKKLGSYSNKEDLVKYFDLDSIEMKFIYDNSSFNAPLFNFVFKQEKLLEITSGDLEFNGNVISFKSRERTPVFFYDGWHEYLSFIDYKNNVTLKIEKNKNNTNKLYNCTLIDASGFVIKKFKIKKNHYYSIFHGMKNPMFFSDDYNYFTKEGDVYCIDKMTVLTTRSSSYSIYFDTKNRLLYSAKSNEIEIYDLDKFEKIDSIVFNKKIKGISFSKNKQIALLKMQDEINILYDLKSRNIICSFRFIKLGYDRKFGGIIVQAKGDFYYECPEYYQNILINSNKHIRFKGFSEFQKKLKANYNITFDENVLNFEGSKYILHHLRVPKKLNH